MVIIFDVNPKIDDNLGPQYMQNRWYDPLMGRFISRDPLEFSGGDYNLYRYVANNPVNYVDPNGTFLIGAVVGAVAGAVGGYSGAHLQNPGNATGAVVSAVVGGALGALGGLVDPTEGVATVAAIGALSGEVGDVGGQIITAGLAGQSLGQSFSGINLGSVVGSTIGGGLGGFTGGAFGAEAASLGFGEFGQSAISAEMGFAPGAVGGALGAKVGSGCK